VSAVSCRLPRVILPLALVGLASSAFAGMGKNKAEERQELMTKLQRDLFKVDRSIAVTEDLIAHSRSAPFLPDLFFRLAELYVEKSRYRYHLEAERRAEGEKTSLVVPEVRLLKEKAISLYQKIVNDFPDYRDNDKVRFFMAHEYRELGKYDEMIKIHEENAEKSPNSPLALEGLLIIGDYHFDKSELDKAETYYLKILDHPPSSVHDLARYKMGWVWINRGKHAEAVKYFEAAAASPVIEGADAKALNVKSLALSDLVYSYTEAKPAKGVIKYFENLADNSVIFATILEKLGNRYYIKQEFENAAPAYRRLLTISHDTERDPDRVQRLYETIKASKGKVTPRAEDVVNIVRVAAAARLDLKMKSDERHRLLEDFEIMARDLSTNMQIDAQKSEDKKLQSEAADAYEAYLSLFQVPKYRVSMEKNRAEALFAAGRMAEAGRQYEEVAKQVKGPEQEEAIYNAVAAYHEALKDPDKLTYFQRVDARGGIKQMGAFYVHSFPTNARVPDIKLNVARAYYEEGEFKQAGDLYAAFACEHPSHKDVSAAVDLALDAYHNLKDAAGLDASFRGLEQVGQKMLGCAGLAANYHNHIRDVLSKAKVEEMSEIQINDSGGTDSGERLLKFAEMRKGTDVAQEAMRTAFSQYIERRDFKQANDVAQKIMQQYPRSPTTAFVILTLARSATEIGDFDQAATYYEQMYERFPGESKAYEALLTAADLRMKSGDMRQAIASLERAATNSKRPEILAKLAEARLKNGDPSGAVQAAEQALRGDPSQGLAAAVIGKVLLDQKQLAEAESKLTQAVRAMQKAATHDPEQLAKVYFYLGECYFEQFKLLGLEAVDKKVALLTNAQGAYSGAAQLGGEWAVAGMFRLGQAFSALSEAIGQMPEPAGLNAAQKAQFRAALEQQTGPLKQQAEESFSTCVKKSEELEVYTPFALACRTRHDVDGAGPRAVPAGNVDAGRLAPFRDALLKNPGDGAALEGMARVFLDAGALGRARLVLQRLIEVDENRPWAFSALGTVLAKLGEPETAKEAYKKALDLDAAFDKAIVGLAALKCRSGDVDEGRKDLSKVKKFPAGSDVDLDLGPCRSGGGGGQ
jgi:cellulose synthase operon protein C